MFYWVMAARESPLAHRAGERDRPYSGRKEEAGLDTEDCRAAGGDTPGECQSLLPGLQQFCIRLVMGSCRHFRTENLVSDPEWSQAGCGAPGDGNWLHRIYTTMSHLRLHDVANPSRGASPARLLAGWTVAGGQRGLGGTPQSHWGRFRLDVGSRPTRVKVHGIRRAHWLRHINTRGLLERFLYWRGPVQFSVARPEDILEVREVGNLRSGGSGIALVPVSAALVRALLYPHLLMNSFHARLRFFFNEAPPYGMFSNRHFPRVLFRNGHTSKWLDPLEVDHPQLNMTPVVTGAYQLITGYGNVINFAPTDGDTVKSINGLPTNQT